LKESKGIVAEELIHPFIWQKQPKNKEKIVVWTNQWRNWKGIGHFIRKAGKINANIYLFGGGREYYNFKDKLSPNCKYFGFVSPDRINEEYSKVMFSVDLTGQSKKYYGHYNRTTIEPMFYNCISVANEKIIEPYSFIPKDCVLRVNKDNFFDKINELLENENRRKEITKNAFEWAKNKYQDKFILKQIIG
jgi:glycosyltransferase involved in cell wall biosynthesis